MRKLAIAGLLVVGAVMAVGGDDARAKTPKGELAGPPGEDSAKDGPQPTTAPSPVISESAAWGQAGDGIACRLIVNADYCQGEPISATIQLKNVSSEKKYLVNIFTPEFGQFVKLDISGPAGKPKLRSGNAQRSVGPDTFVPLEPNQVRQIDLPDLHDYYYTGLDKDGNYRLSYAYTGYKPPKSVPWGTTVRNGKTETIYKDMPDEIVEKAWGGTVAASPGEFVLRKLTKEDLTVHEWGVFTIYTDMQYCNIDRKSEWETLPEDFYRQFPRQRLHWVPAAWDKPIVYLYSRRPCLKVEMKVSFGSGVPVVWWPACSAPLDQSITAPEKAPRFHSLTWSALVGEKVPGGAIGGWRGGQAGQWYAAVPGNALTGWWLKDARDVSGASPVTVVGSKLARSRPWATDRVETERFIFYDGLVPAPDYLRCTAAAPDSVTIKNAAEFKIGKLFVIDRRGVAKGDPVRYAALAEPVPAGGEVKVALRSVPASDWPASAVKDLRQALLDAGLFGPEADSMLKIWKTGLFDREGVTAFHVLPREEYDRMLPMALSPAGAAVTRVGLALHVRLEGEPALQERAKELIRDLGSDKYKVRDAATQELSRMGPAAFRLLRQTAESGPSPEVRERATGILNSIDGASYLGKVPEDPGVRKP